MVLCSSCGTCQYPCQLWSLFCITSMGSEGWPLRPADVALELQLWNARLQTHVGFRRDRHLRELLAKVQLRVPVDMKQWVTPLHLWLPPQYAVVCCFKMHFCNGRRYVPRVLVVRAVVLVDRQGSRRAKLQHLHLPRPPNQAEGNCPMRCPWYRDFALLLFSVPRHEARLLRCS